jgi:predicted nucleotidyltransferase
MQDDQEQIIIKLKKSIEDFKLRYPLANMAVFGSALRSDFNEDSDVDILIDFRSDDFLLFNSLAEELETLLGKKIDLVTARSLKPRQYEYLKNHLLYV